MEYLFSKYRIYEVTNTIFNEANKSVNSLTSASFEKNTPDQILENLFDQHKLTTPVLDDANLFQREPKDVKISIPARNGFQRYSDIMGTRFEIIVPYHGDKDLFYITPNTFTSNSPFGTVQDGELHFNYEIPVGRDKQEVYQNFNANLNAIKRWLNNMDGDVSQFNNKLKQQLTSAIHQRKQKIDEDRDAANSSGIPIR